MAVETVCSFRELSDRYAFDFDECSSDKGYAQFDTRHDASYYGHWVNPHTFHFVAFMEGDITENRCDTAEELSSLVREYANKLGDFFIGIDPGFDEALKQRFIEIGLGDLLHPERDHSKIDWDKPRMLKSDRCSTHGPEGKCERRAEGWLLYKDEEKRRTEPAGYGYCVTCAEKIIRDMDKWPDLGGPTFLYRGIMFKPDYNNEPLRCFPKGK